MLEENVVSAAGTGHTDEMTLTEMERLILDAGFQPQRRDTQYRKVKTSLVGQEVHTATLS